MNVYIVQAVCAAMMAATLLNSNDGKRSNTKYRMHVPNEQPIDKHTNVSQPPTMQSSFIIYTYWYLVVPLFVSVKLLIYSISKRNWPKYWLTYDMIWTPYTFLDFCFLFLSFSVFCARKYNVFFLHFIHLKSETN